MGKRFWQRTVRTAKQVKEIVYSCPECNQPVLKVPVGTPIPLKTKIIKCVNGHSVTVPDIE